MQNTRVMTTTPIDAAETTSTIRTVTVRHAFLPTLAPYPIACFTGALVTDIVYWRSLDVQWENFSAWLITAGLFLAAVAAIGGIIDLLTGRRAYRLGWPHAVGYVLAVAVSFVNILVHSRDAYTAVVPTGITLSAVVVVILIITGWLGSTVVERRAVGVVR